MGERCPTCGKEFQRLYQHKCKAASAAPSAAAASNDKKTTAASPSGQPCSTCGKVFQRLYQHKCKAAPSSSSAGARPKTPGGQQQRQSPPSSAGTGSSAGPASTNGAAKPPQKQEKPCPTCGKMFQRLYQHKCKATGASLANCPTTKEQPSVNSSASKEQANTGAPAGSARTTSAPKTKTPKEQQCPTCGKMFQRLYQHKCKAGVSPPSSFVSSVSSGSSSSSSTSAASQVLPRQNSGETSVKSGDSVPTSEGETKSSAPKGKPCPGCGKFYQRLYQHKCKAATPSSATTQASLKHKELDAPESDASSDTRRRSLENYSPHLVDDPVSLRKTSPADLESSPDEPQSGSSDQSNNSVLLCDAGPCTLPDQGGVCSCENRRVTRSMVGQTCPQCSGTYELRERLHGPGSLPRQQSGESSRRESVGGSDRSDLSSEGSAPIIYNQIKLCVYANKVKQLNAAGNTNKVKNIKNVVGQQQDQDDASEGRNEEEEDEDEGGETTASFSPSWPNPEHPDPTLLDDIPLRFGLPEIPHSLTDSLDEAVIQPAEGSHADSGDYPPRDRQAYDMTERNPAHAAFPQGLNTSPYTRAEEESRLSSYSSSRAAQTARKTRLMERSQDGSDVATSSVASYERHVSPDARGSDRAGQSSTGPSYTEGRDAWDRYHDTDRKQPLSDEED